MQENLISRATVNDITFITNTLFDLLGISLIVVMIFIFIHLYRKIIKLIEGNSTY
ncbi:hypothetical protein [Flavobacterium humi]|uniref:hypothetical protein n=1 Tax=Flavobacterium humi TaxID=2562683 RepID=UPI00146F50AB|nr:hypothetical protein [Flavobacterium humi]